MDIEKFNKNFINSLIKKYKIKSYEPYIDIKIKRNCYCFEFDDDDEYEDDDKNKNENECKIINELANAKNIKKIKITIRIRKDKNKKYIDCDDVINELNKNIYDFLSCNHKFLEVLEKEKNKDVYKTWFGS
jgi:hypothetical protein